MPCQPYETLHKIVYLVPLEADLATVVLLWAFLKISTPRRTRTCQLPLVPTTPCCTLIGLIDLHDHPDPWWGCLCSIVGLVPCEASGRTSSVVYSFISLLLAGLKLKCVRNDRLMSIRCYSILSCVFSDCDLGALLWRDELSLHIIGSKKTNETCSWVF